MATGLLHIDLDAVIANWRSLDALTGAGCETGAVVKADAYGLGAGPVALALARAGARRFFVAATEEGVALRRALGPGPMIGVFSGHMAGDTAALAGADLVAMLNSPEQVARHLQALPDQPFGLQLDTGMNRLGLEEPDWAALAPDLLPRGPQLIMSHLACSDAAPDSAEFAMNARQLAVFRRMTDGLGVKRSLSATGGILLGPDYHFDITRPGIGLHGCAPFDQGAKPLRLALPVVQTRLIAPGETVGYSNTFTATRPTRVATLAAGYADGLLRGLSSRATLWAGDQPCPLIGRVSMDLITVDVTDLAVIPDHLDILTPGQSADDLAALCGTIGYELLTQLGARYQRLYRGAGLDGAGADGAAPLAERSPACA